MAAITFDLKIDGRDLIGSGSVIIHGKEEIILLADDVEFRIRFENTEDKKTKVSGEQPNPKELILKFLNFGNSLGTSYNSTIGVVNGRNLRASFFVYTLGAEGQEARLVAYTLSLGETETPPVDAGGVGNG